MQAAWLGIDITTTEMALAVASGEAEGFASLPMQGATTWMDKPECPGFDLKLVPGMLEQLLQQLSRDGWQFDQPGALSLSCRQHDMVVLGEDGSLLLPALSWQCNAASDQTHEMVGNAFLTEMVGMVEPRFVLPKLAYVLETDGEVASQIAQVMTTGDWVLGNLASEFRLSTSDALSNGLLLQQSRELATDVLLSLGMNPDWFPAVAQSGSSIGSVAGGTGLWQKICEVLRGWTVVAGLGDNHASALGCGMRDEETMVVSAGTSGTVNLACRVDSALRPVEQPAVRFEFYRQHSLLLRMLAFCGDWYNRFRADYCPGESHGALNALIADVAPTDLIRVACGDVGEEYPSVWGDLPLGRQVASVQYSICVELLLRVKAMLAEAPNGQVKRYVLTGGLSQSDFFQQVFAAGIQLVDPGKEALLSGRTGPLRYKTSASGALFNARMPEWGHELANMPPELFPLQPCAASSEALSQRFQQDLG